MQNFFSLSSLRIRFDTLPATVTVSKHHISIRIHCSDAYHLDICIIQQFRVQHKSSFLLNAFNNSEILYQHTGTVWFIFQSDNNKLLVIRFCTTKQQLSQLCWVESPLISTSLRQSWFRGELTNSTELSFTYSGSTLLEQNIVVRLVTTTTTFQEDSLHESNPGS